MVAKDSREVEDFLDVLKKDTPLEVVITTHLHLENILNRLISKVIPDEEEFENLELDYNQRVKLAVALGLKVELKEPLLFYGTIRNKFAHNLNATIDKSLMDSFFNTIPPKHKSEIKRITKTHIEGFGLPKGSTYNNINPNQKFGILSFFLFTVICRAVETAPETKINKTPL